LLGAAWEARGLVQPRSVLKTAACRSFDQSTGRGGLSMQIGVSSPRPSRSWTSLREVLLRRGLHA
jgi:hypothetical protein